MVTEGVKWPKPRLPIMRRFVLLMLIVAPWIASCAAQAVDAHMRVSGPFLSSDATLFDDGVDFVEDPGRLRGSWLGDFHDSLRRRIERADTIAVVRVEALGEGTDTSGGTTHVLSVSVEDTLKGELPDNATLASEPQSPGFGTIERAHSRLLHGRFTVFLRWYERAEDVVAGHFHLSPATNEVLDEVSKTLRH